MKDTIVKLRYKLFKMRFDAIILNACNQNLVGFYDDEVIANLRNYYYGGISLSIILLSIKRCAHRCYDRALMMTFGMGDDDYKIVCADIDGIRLNPEHVHDYNKLKKQGLPVNEHYGNHAFVERTLKDGRVLVYDTTAGLVYDKEVYYRLQHPKIVAIISKNDLLKDDDYLAILNDDGIINRQALPLLLPSYEESAKNEPSPYKEMLLQEIEIFKKQVDYEGLCKEIEAEKELSLRKIKP